MLVLLDDAVVLSGDYQVRTVDLEINCGVSTQGRLNIYLDDGCDVISGFFRSKEDIEKVRDELNKYLKDIKNASKRID
jgi:hypothetical protein